MLRLFALLTFALVSSVPVPLAAEERGAPLRAGVSVVDITPPIGYRMSGYFSERFSDGVLDPLHAKAVVFQQGEVEAALVFCDLIGVPRNVSDRARRAVSEATGIPPGHVAISATHSHTGPLYFGALREQFRRKTIEQHGRDIHEEIDYAERLVAKIAEAVRDARRAARSVRLAAGSALEGRLSFNRRFHMSDGSVQFNPGQLNPNIVRPAGPIDPEVGLLRLDGAEGEPFAAVVSFALHLDTVGGTKYSADFPKHLQDGLRRALGPEFVSLFGAGTCGDINHIDVSTRGRRSAEEIGGLLAETVADALPELRPVSRPSLAVRSEAVEAPLQRHTPEEVAAARELMDRVADPAVPFLDRVNASKIMALELYEGSTIPLEVQVFRLSPEAAIVTLPGEVFVELGLAIKEASPFETTLVIELTNDVPAYIPTRKAFEEGSYETVNSRVQPGWGEAMVEAAIRLLEDLKPGP